jgi:hypothetical protein
VAMPDRALICGTLGGGPQARGERAGERASDDAWERPESWQLRGADDSRAGGGRMRARLRSMGTPAASRDG